MELMFNYFNLKMSLKAVEKKDNVKTYESQKSFISVKNIYFLF